jgi:predicted nucleic acid-binding Zn ribbon protein
MVRLMPAYTYRCPNCGSRHTITCDRDSSTKRGYDEGHAPCNECAMGSYRRDYRGDSGAEVSFAPVLQSHYNHTTSAPSHQEVHGHRDFREKLKILGAQQTARTGIESNLVPRDARGTAAARRAVKASCERYGDAGLKEQHDAAVKRGEKDPVTKTVI